MKLLLSMSIGILLLLAAEAKECQETAIEEECHETEYNSYVDCMRNKRAKRSIDCENSTQEEPCTDCDHDCQLCDCDYCAVNQCQNHCTACCPGNPPCSTTRCCHKTCHAKCKSSTCRTECRRNCTEKISSIGDIINVYPNITQVEKTRHNITTIINLHNFVNNTNIVDVPLNINTTNVNNVTLNNNQSSNNEPLQQVCCHVVGPKQCVATNNYPFVKCFHVRRKVCGSVCNAPIVHEQLHQVCNKTSNGTSCHQQVIFIPQPQPRCAYQPTWPYVSCAVRLSPQNCEGCYLHYNSPFPQLPPQSCSSGCYDDGYGTGPYYRQGPFYRPEYTHIPSCYQLGTCGSYGGPGVPYVGYNPALLFGGYGSYGTYGSIAPHGYNYPSPYGGYNPGVPYAGYNPYIGYGGISYGVNVPYPFPPPYLGSRIPSYNGIKIQIPEGINSIRQRTPEAENKPSSDNVKIEDPVLSYYEAPMIEHISAAGFSHPFVPQFTYYNLPPEVDIEASISHPAKQTRYAQITINKETNKKETNAKETIKETVNTTSAKENVLDEEPVVIQIDSKLELPKTPAEYKETFSLTPQGKTQAVDSSKALEGNSKLPKENQNQLDAKALEDTDVNKTFGKKKEFTADQTTVVELEDSN